MIIDKIYEIQNKGKGIISELLPENLLDLNIQTKIEQGSNVTITGEGTTTSPYIISSATPNGSETKVTQGTNVSVTGTGTASDPYIISSTTPDGSETKIQQGSNITITGSGTQANPYIINGASGGGTTPDGSETKLESGTTTTVSGNGTIATPYKVEVNTVSYQKTLTSPTSFTSNNYTLTSADNDKLIFIVNGATAVTITVPTGLPSEFFATFIQKGANTVTFLASGTTLQTPVGLIIKGTYYQASIDKVGNTEVFNITGNTKT